MGTTVYAHGECPPFAGTCRDRRFTLECLPQFLCTLFIFKTRSLREHSAHQFNDAGRAARSQDLPISSLLPSLEDTGMHLFFYVGAGESQLRSLGLHGECLCIESSPQGPVGDCLLYKRSFDNFWGTSSVKE